jgi:hypothetical protein
MLVQSSLAKGHIRIPWQRLLMMEACDMDAPNDMRAAYEPYAPRLRPADWQRMRESAAEFAMIVLPQTRTSH